jgi:NDP-sugar pyrophosphorylase family protein
MSGVGLSSTWLLLMLARQGVEIAFSREPSPLGTGGALRFALDKVQAETCVVLNGDSYFSLNLPQALYLCAKIKQHIPAFVYLEAPIGEDPDKRDYIVSNEKNGQTGYRAQFSLDQGMRELVEG